jgi:RNA polymerase sigma-70 factor (ECF subfamily)
MASSQKRQLKKDTVEFSDRELVSCVRKGETDCFAMLFERYRNKLFFYLRHLVGTKEEAEDILQNVFVKAYEKLDTFDARRTFSSWVYRIAHNEAINYLKRRSRKTFLSWEDIVSVKDQLESSSQERSPFEEWIRKEVRRDVRAALEKIPEMYREVLILRYYLDHSYEEIAKIINRPMNTVGTLLSRAKKHLLKEINKK